MKSVVQQHKQVLIDSFYLSTIFIIDILFSWLETSFFFYFDGIRYIGPLRLFYWSWFMAYEFWTTLAVTGLRLNAVSFFTTRKNLTSFDFNNSSLFVLSIQAVLCTSKKYKNSLADYHQHMSLVFYLFTLI